MRTSIEAFGKTWRKVWAEDECLRHDPDAEHVEGAWLRLYGEDYPGTAGCPSEDWGDSFGYHINENRMVVSSYDGHSIWEVLK